MSPPQGAGTGGLDFEKMPENGVARIMADEHFNVYDRTGSGMTRYKP